MSKSVEGVYEYGAVRLLEPLPGIEKARVRVTVLSETPLPAPGSAPDPTDATGDVVADHYRPRTELGRRLVERRRAYVKAGGKLSTRDEIDAEARQRRGQVAED